MSNFFGAYLGCRLYDICTPPAPFRNIFPQHAFSLSLAGKFLSSIAIGARKCTRTIARDCTILGAGMICHSPTSSALYKSAPLQVPDIIEDSGSSSFSSASPSLAPPSLALALALALQ